jgi:DNA polymerase I-like protein with 3'-5' exonuclease and polymerase domains
MRTKPPDLSAAHLMDPLLARNILQRHASLQGACADASMLAMAAIDELLFEHGIDGGPVAWLHDAIVLEVPTEHPVMAAELLVKAMLDAFAQTFPGAPFNGLVEANSGLNWAAAKEKKAA